MRTMETIKYGFLFGIGLAMAYHADRVINGISEFIVEVLK